MPELTFTTRWPDGRSLQTLLALARRPRPPRGRARRTPSPTSWTGPSAALTEASDRVEARWGHPCTAAQASLATIRRVAAGQPEGARRGVAFDPPSPPSPVTRRDRSRAPAGRARRVAVVGGGQAGLSASWFLARAGVEHVVLERQTAAHEWQDHRWDSFTLVTPERPVPPARLPLPRRPAVRLHDPRRDVGLPRRVRAPHGSPAARAHDGARAPPGRRAAASCSSWRRPDGPAVLEAEQVVVAVGGYHDPRVPAAGRAAAGRPRRRCTRRPTRTAAALPAGAVLVVGTGQSGRPDRRGPPPRRAAGAPGRRVGAALRPALPRPGLHRLARGDGPLRRRRRGHARRAARAREDEPLHDRPRRRPRHRPAPVRPRGHGPLRPARRRRRARGWPSRRRSRRRSTARTAWPRTSRTRSTATSPASVSSAPDRGRATPRSGARTPSRRRSTWTRPASPRSSGRPASSPTSAGCGCPVFDGRGTVGHHRGVTAVDGLHFLGLPWLHTWGSGRFAGLTRDAEHVVDHVVEHLRPPVRLRLTS